MINSSTSVEGELVQRLFPISYSVFFTLSAAAFLCICQFWLQMIHLMEETVDGPWHRNPVLVISIIIVTVEVAHGICTMFRASIVIDALYFVWQSIVDIMIAIIGMAIA